jgi:hypothetical protein
MKTIWKITFILFAIILISGCEVEDSYGSNKDTYDRSDYEEEYENSQDSLYINQCKMNYEVCIGVVDVLGEDRDCEKEWDDCFERYKIK